jgi:DNA repair exonuclease SbcCD ATPase subunit
LRKRADLTKQPLEGGGLEEEHEEEAPVPSRSPVLQSNGIPPSNGTDTTDTTERLEALARERDALRTEVSELRKSLEAIQSKHEEEVTTLQEELEETATGKEDAESKYQELLGRVNTIRSQLGERLKSDAVCLCTAIQELF